MSKIQDTFTGKGRALRDDEKSAMQAFIAKYKTVLTTSPLGFNMNDEYLKYAMEKLRNMTTDELEVSLREFGFDVERIHKEQNNVGQSTEQSTSSTK